MLPSEVQLSLSRYCTHQPHPCTVLTAVHHIHTRPQDDVPARLLNGPGLARTILLFHISSARPSKQPLMVRTFLKVYMELGSYFLFLQEQIKDIIISVHADFVGLSSLATLIVVRLAIVPLLPRYPRRQWQVVCWADILLDVISGVESAMWEGCPRTMTGVSQYWFSGHFRQVFSTPMHYPALTLATTCGANRAS